MAENAAEAGNRPKRVQNAAIRAEARRAAGAAHLKREAAEEVADRADEEDHEVHCHRVCGVLGAAEARLDHRKAALEEEDHERADHDPGVVRTEQSLVRRGGDIAERFAAARRAVGRAGRISAGGEGRDGEKQRQQREGQPEYDALVRFCFHFFHPNKFSTFSFSPHSFPPECRRAAEKK